MIATCLIISLIVIPNIHPSDQKDVRRHKIISILKGASNQSPCSGENIRRIGFAPINCSGSFRINMRIKRRDDWIIKRERNVEKPLHGPSEWENAISIYLKLRKSIFQPQYFQPICVTNVLDFNFVFNKSLEIYCIN